MEILKKFNNWLCWQSMPSKEEGQKPNKVPFNPKTGKHAKTNDSSTWGSYEEALEGQKKYGFTGIGFVIPKGYCVIDIDEAGLSHAEDIIKLTNSYTEKSPSGKGYHIIIKCDMEKLNYE